jgi:hypothetical protein
MRVLYWNRRTDPHIVCVSLGRKRDRGVIPRGGAFKQGPPQISALRSEKANLIMLSIVRDQHVACHDPTKDCGRIFVLKKSQTIRPWMGRVPKKVILCRQGNRLIVSEYLVD